MRQSIHISPEDLVAIQADQIDFKNCDAYLLGIVADNVVELSDHGGAGADFVAEFISQGYPELTQSYGRQYIEAVARSLLGADIVSFSTLYTRVSQNSMRVTLAINFPNIGSEWSLTSTSSRTRYTGRSGLR